MPAPNEPEVRVRPNGRHKPAAAKALVALPRFPRTPGPTSSNLVASLNLFSQIQTILELVFGHYWQAENPDGSWDISDFEADPGRSQRASSDSRHLLADGTR